MRDRLRAAWRAFVRQRLPPWPSRGSGPAALGAQPVAGAGSTITRADLLIALGLALATVLTRFPLRARLLPSWDAVQFALALREYDVVKHQPHPPGYILYVAAARAVDALVGDPTESLTWLAIVASPMR